MRSNALCLDIVPRLDLVDCGRHGGDAVSTLRCDRAFEERHHMQAGKCNKTNDSIYWER